MMKSIAVALTICITSFNYSIGFADGIYNIKDFGAQNDTTKLSTSAIQKAIDNCFDAGGGTVLIPGGKYVCGTLFLKSNVNLQVQAGGELLGSNFIDDYAENIPAVVEAPAFSQCLIYAHGAKNISVTGMGIINARGYHQYFKEKRPMLMRFEKCENVLVQDITLRNAASWCSLFIDCDKLRINGVKVYSRVQKNNDGFDIDGCKDVTISDCILDTGDDPICGKSTTNRLLENMVVTNCIISSNTSGFKLGTSSKSGFKNISVSNCVMSNCFMGAIKLTCVDGGIMENIKISNITMHNVDGPLFIRLGARGKTYETPQSQDFTMTGEKAVDSTPVGKIKDISISDIQAYIAGTDTARTGILIMGVTEENIENISLTNIRLVFPGTGNSRDAERFLPNLDKVYPEAFFFGTLPCYAMYVQYAKNIHLENVDFSYKDKGEQRPAVTIKDVSGVIFNNSTFRAPENKTTILTLERASDVSVRNCFVNGEANSFMHVLDDSTGNLKCYYNDFSNCRKLAQYPENYDLKKITGQNNLLKDAVND